jgi:hypothetical protein
MSSLRSRSRGASEVESLPSDSDCDMYIHTAQGGGKDEKNVPSSSSETFLSVEDLGERLFTMR